MDAVSPSFIRRAIGADGVCTLTFDRPESGANIFDRQVLEELNAHLAFIESEDAITGLVIESAKKSIFIAGADLHSIMQQAATGKLRDFIGYGQQVFNRLAALKIPTAAAIHGACAGGGYEITLACDWRVASDDPATRIGLPETTLGLIPAWGGATRLPRLIGPEAAVDVVVKGKLHSAKAALELGLIDQLVPRERLIDAARAKLAEGKRQSPRISVNQTSLVESGAQSPASARALKVIAEGFKKSIEESLALELDAIVELAETESTRNLVRGFFQTERVRKGSSKLRTDKLTRAAVIGAGVMGSGIAQWLSSRGLSVILRDVNEAQLERGLTSISKTYDEAVKRGLMSADQARQGRERIVAAAGLDSLGDAEIIVEAAVEKLEVKKQIFAELAAAAGPKTILATNTSALSITEIAASTDAPERVIGLHFFNPVSRMKLVEVVISTESDFDVMEQALAFVRQIGKLPVLVRDCPGFLVNRVLFPYLLEAARLFENGVAASVIDDALVEWGMPMGPLRLIDEIGLDITNDIAATLVGPFGQRMEAPALLRKMQDAGLLGRKSGGGFYTYDSGRQQGENTAVAKLKANTNAVADELAHRLVFLMVNEAARCLETKVVNAAEDADFGMMMGTGFPAGRGGPLRYAQHIGVRKVIAEMEQLAASGGDKFRPCELLRKMAESGATFYGD